MTTKSHSELHSLRSILGFYTFGRLVGEGAFAKVYTAMPLGRHGVGKGAPVEPVAVKRMELSASEVSAEDIEQEISLLRAMDHPNIIKLMGVYSMESSSVICIVMELSKCTLTRLLKQDKINEDCFLYIIYCICEALVYLHGIKVIHRDLKPDNVLVNGDGLIKLSDFGVSAKVVEQRTLVHGKKNVHKFDGRTTFTGTPSFLAPEVVKVFKGELDCYYSISDMFSCGCVAHYCLFGSSPVVGASLEGVIKQLRTEKQFGNLLGRVKAKTGLQIPPKVLSVVKKWLNSEPKKRPSAIESRAVLLQFKTLIKEGNNYTASTVKDVHLSTKDPPRHLQAFNLKSEDKYKKMKEARKLKKASAVPAQSQNPQPNGPNQYKEESTIAAAAPAASTHPPKASSNQAIIQNHQINLRRRSFYKSHLPPIPENYNPQAPHHHQINGSISPSYPYQNYNQIDNQPSRHNSNWYSYSGPNQAPTPLSQNKQPAQNDPRPNTMLDFPEHQHLVLKQKSDGQKNSPQSASPKPSLVKSKPESSIKASPSSTASSSYISYSHSAISNAIKHANASQIHACFFCSELVLVSTSVTTMGDLYYLDASQQRSFNVGEPTEQLVKAGKCNSSKDGCLLMTTKQKIIFYNVSEGKGELKLRRMPLDLATGKVHGLCRSRASDNVLVLTDTEIQLFEGMSTKKLCAFPEKAQFTKSQLGVGSAKELGFWCTNYMGDKVGPERSFILMGLTKLKKHLVTFKVSSRKVEFILFHDLINTKINFVDCAVDKQGKEVFSVVTEDSLFILGGDLQLTQRFDLSKNFPPMFIVGLCGSNKIKMLAISKNQSDKQRFLCFDITEKHPSLEQLSVPGKIGQKLKLIHWTNKMFILYDGMYLHFFVRN